MKAMQFNTELVEQNKNFNIASTIITDKIRVSSAAIFYEEFFGNYYLLETWIFSDDPTIKSRQIIHGTTGIFPVSQKEKDNVVKVHNYVAGNLKKKITAQ